MILPVQYAERRIQFAILFTFSLFGEYINPEYVPIHVICRVNQAEYVIHILVAVPQEFVNIYSKRRPVIHPCHPRLPCTFVSVSCVC